MKDTIITKWTVWSLYGLSAVADDRPLHRDGNGGFTWPAGSWNVRNIARFDTREEAQAALDTMSGGHKPTALTSVSEFPFEVWEVA